MRKYAENLAKVMQGVRKGYPKYFDLSDPLQRSVVSEYFGGEEVMQAQYPLLYKAYGIAAEQGLGEVNYKGFCDDALIYDIRYNHNIKTIIASGRVSLTEIAKTVFVSFSVMQGNTIIKQKNQAYSNCKIIEISCETNEITKEIENGSYTAYLHVSWLPKSSEALRSMAASGSEINVESGLILDSCKYVSKMELYAPTKRKNFNCPADAINEEENHISYNNTTDSISNQEDILVCYQRSESHVDYCYNEERVDDLQKVFIPVHFKTFLTEDVEYVSLSNVLALLLPVAGGGDVYYLQDTTRSIQVEGREISVELDTDWNNCIPESVIYGNRTYQIYVQFDFIVKDRQGRLIKVQTKAESLEEASIETGTDIIHVVPLKLRWGCLAEGTKILMADGREKEIQNIQKGDLIINDKGEKIPVSELITGTEETIFRVVTEGGRKVSASANHPFVTEQGDRLLLSFDYRTMLKVRQGDQYVYDQLSYCYPEEYNGNVYSICVEGGENTVIADGFVTCTNDAVERIERETFVSEDAVLTSAELEEFNRLKETIENR